MKMDTRELARKIEVLGKGNFELMSEYKDAKTKVEILHKECGRKFEILQSNFLKAKNLCRVCGEEKKISESINKKKETKKRNEIKLKEILSKHPGKYEVLSEVENTTTPISVKMQCGHITLKTLGSLSLGTGCVVCMSERYTKTHEEYMQKFDKNFLGVFQINDEYKDSREKISVTHKKCGYTFKRIAGNLPIFGTSCPKCGGSTGELIVSEVLDSMSVKYERERMVVINGKIYYYDFYLPEFKSFIEFDGLQHFKQVDFFRSLEKTTESDEVKNNYCRKNGYDLLRIADWEKHHSRDLIEDFIKSDEHECVRYNQLTIDVYK